MSNNKYSAGIILLLAGFIILLGKLGFFNFLATIFWPLLVLIPGILLHVLYFGRLLPAPVLVPGGMLVVYALMFIVCNIFGWDSLKYLWPLFIFGAAVGIYEYYLFSSTKQRILFTVSVGLAAISALFMILVMMWGWGIYVIAGLLIAAGALMLLYKGKRW